MQITARASTSPTVDVQPGGGLAAIARIGMSILATPDQPGLTANVKGSLSVRAQPQLMRPIQYTESMRATAGVAARIRPQQTMTATAASTAAPSFGYERWFVLAGQSDLAAETFDGFVIIGWQLAGTWLKTVGNGGRMQSSSGWDLWFEDLNGVRLSHALVAYDGAAGTATVDLRIPSWAVQSDFRFKLKYGATVLANMADPAGCWQRAAAVWPWTSGADTTGRGRNLTPSGVTAGTAPGSGVFGASSYARASGPTWINGLTAMAVEVMITPSSAANDAGVLRVGGTAANSADMALYTAASGQKWAVFTRFGGGTATYSGLAATDSLKTQRQHVIGGGRSGAAPTLYIDGAAQTLTAASGSAVGTGGLNVVAAENVSVGLGTGEQAAAVPGTYGRVIVWPFVPSAAWAAASYRIQTSPAVMIGMSDENPAGADNHGPVAVPMTGQAIENIESQFDVAGRSFDPDGNTLSAYLPSSPAAGTARIVSGQVGYKPQGGTAGQTHDVAVGVRDPSSKASQSIVRVSVRAGVGGRIHQPKHRPFAESDIRLWEYSAGDPSPPAGDWSQYLLIVWPDSAFRGTMNLNGLKYKGVFEIGGLYAPLGNNILYRHGGNSPNWTRLDPGLRGYGGMLQRSFANDMPAALRGSTRVFWWCDGIQIDTCYGSGKSAGVDQDCWHGDIFKTGIARDTTKYDRYSDAIILRTDIVNGTYFFSEYVSATAQGQNGHSDIMQNEQLDLRSLTVWKFHSKWDGQGWYLNSAGSGGIIPHDAYFEISYSHMEPMPWDPISSLFTGVPGTGYKPIATSDATSTNASTTTLNGVDPGRYYPIFLGQEVYLQDTVAGCTGNARTVIGRASGTTAAVSFDTTNKKVSISADNRCYTAGQHSYPYTGATQGGLWDRPSNTFKNWAWTKAPSAPVVATDERGLVRRITTKADLLAYLNNGT